MCTDKYLQEIFAWKANVSFVFTNSMLWLRGETKGKLLGGGQPPFANKEDVRRVLLVMLRGFANRYYHFADRYFQFAKW